MRGRGYAASPQDFTAAEQRSVSRRGAKQSDLAYVRMTTDQPFSSKRVAFMSCGDCPLLLAYRRTVTTRLLFLPVTRWESALSCPVTCRSALSPQHSLFLRCGPPCPC